jgi:hypothetical protein
MADYTISGAGDNPRPGAPNLAWQIDSIGAASQPSARVLRTWVGGDFGATRIGGVDPTNTRQATPANFGAGGLFPRVTDGLVLEHFDPALPNGFFVALVGDRGPDPGVTVRRIGGRFWLDGIVLFLAGIGGLDGSGRGALTIVPPGGLPPGLQGAALSFSVFAFDVPYTRGEFGSEWTVRL